MSTEDTELVFSQYAQDPYEEYYEMLQNTASCSSNLINKEPKKSKPRRKERTKKLNPMKSFVMSRIPRRGIKLIKISVIDLGVENPDSGSDSENVIINAQYVVKDLVDSIMDETEYLVKKISKSLLDTDY